MENVRSYVKAAHLECSAEDIPATIQRAVNGTLHVLASEGSEGPIVSISHSVAEIRPGTFMVTVVCVKQ